MIRIGRGAARILEVDDDQVVYTDEGGVRHAIALVEARAAMLDRSPDLGFAPFVALRSLAGPPFRVIFPGSPEICFEFETRDAASAQLVDPLVEGGWRTSDID